MQIAGRVLVVGLASLYILLATQAEPVTATLGYVASGLLVIALLSSFVRRQ